MTDAPWVKSPYTNSSCVEVQMQDHFVLVRDSSVPNSPILKFTPAEWTAFVKAVVEGHFGAAA